MVVIQNILPFVVETSFVCVSRNGKSCPLSEVKWPDNLSRLLNEPENECLQAKWNDALADCKGGKVSHGVCIYTHIMYQGQ